MKTPSMTPRGLRTKAIAAFAAPLSLTVPANATRKRSLQESFDPAHVQRRDSSQKHRSSVVEHRVASVKLSIDHLSEVTTKAKRYRKSVVAKSKSEQTNTSPAMKTNIKDVALDIIQEGTRERHHPPPRSTVVQRTIFSPLIQEEPRTIDDSFFPQVVIASEGESTRLVKELISIDPSLEPTFQAICAKYGDITQNCPLKSGYILTPVLEVICKVVQELQRKHLSEADHSLLNSYYLVVEDAEILKMDVKWLKTRLDEIKAAVNSIIDVKIYNDEINKRVKDIENEKKDLQSMESHLQSMEAQVEKLKSKVISKKSQLDMVTMVTENLSTMINNQVLNIQQFQNKPLMETF